MLKQGYLAIQTTHLQEKRGGVCVFVRMDTVRCNIITTVEACGVALECFIVNGKFEQKFILFAVYFNPSPTDQEIQDQQTLDGLIDKYIQDAHHPIMIVGDLNGPGRKLANKWKKWGLTEQLNEITWKSGNNKGMPDTITVKGINGTASCEQKGYSDHLQCKFTMDEVEIEPVEVGYTRQ